MENENVKALYKVFKVSRNTGRKKTLERNLSESEAQRLVKRYPTTKTTMVCYTKQ